ncbi:MAG: alpha/beta hydrolase [Gammaproteobacteria bacterium]|nr:alpha/beta hydrolase [Gammaproteobacteria bacterium]MCY4276589.1 alpha/beta hydrolase [Gammaproteobacteria bacterium]
MPRWQRNPEPEVPAWFWRAVDTPSREACVLVDECDIVYRSWGDASKPPILLVHGMMAHSRWWDFVAPQLTDDWFVTAIDLGGMGDSDFRHDYSGDTFASEIKSVCDAAGLDERVVLVAHSFGGAMSIKAVNRYPDRFAALVLVDSGLRAPDEGEPERPSLRGSGAYPDRASAEARFRVQPPQEVRAPYTARYIASQSLMPVDGGWAWKFDDDLLGARSGLALAAGEVSSLHLPVALLYGEDSSHCSARTVEYMRELIPGTFLARGIADAQHHVFLDQPEAFVCTLRETLAGLTSS